MNWQLFQLLVTAAGVTVFISAVSIVIALVLGTIVSVVTLSPKPAFALAGRTYISFFRGVPLLVQLLLIYNLLPVMGIDLPGIVAAIIGLSLCTAAFQAENLRGAFASVPRGLVEAAEMAGFSAAQILRRVRVPIAFRLALPALVNEAIFTLKASSLVSVVGVVELTRTAQDLASSTFLPLQLFAAAGLLYLLLSWTIAALGHVMERRMRWGRV